MSENNFSTKEKSNEEKIINILGLIKELYENFFEEET